jgi:hypothetical protein
MSVKQEHAMKTKLIAFAVGVAMASISGAADARRSYGMMRTHWTGNIAHRCIVKHDGPHCWLVDYRHGNARVEGEVFDTAITPLN